MTTNNNGVVVRILGDDSDLQNKLRDSANDLAKWAAAAAAAAAAGVVAITTKTASAAKEIENLSRLVGDSTEEFQRNVAAVKSVGIEQDKYADIMKDVKDRVGDFLTTGAGPMADFFEKIGPKVGVTAQQFKNLSGSQALQLFVDSLEDANLSSSEMTFYMEAMASDASALIPLLGDGGVAMQELGDRAAEAGAVMSSIDLAKLGQFQEKIVESSEAMTGLTNMIAVQFAPVLTGLADKFSDTAGGADGMRSAVEKAYDIVIQGAAFSADMLRGLEIVLKGLEAGFFALQAGASWAFLQISKGIDGMINFAKDGVNELIEVMNSIPLLDLDLTLLETGASKATTVLEQAFEAAAGITKEKFQEMHDLALEPMPSKAIEDWAQAVEDNATKAAEAVVAAKASAALTVPGMPNTEGADPEVVAEQAKNDALLASYQAYASARISSGEDFNKSDLQNSKDHAAAQKAIASQQLSDRMNVASQMFGNLSSLMDTENKKLFAVGKAAAIAQAVVDGISAAISSYKAGAAVGGPILGAAFAATSVVATGAMISQLASASPNSTSGGSAPPSGGGAGGVSSTTGGQQGQQATGASERSTLYVEGLSGDGLVSMMSARAMAQKLIEFQEDGGRVVLA